jgi:hypothetical protein
MAESWLAAHRMVQSRSYDTNAEWPGGSARNVQRKARVSITKYSIRRLLKRVPFFIVGRLAARAGAVATGSSRSECRLGSALQPGAILGARLCAGGRRGFSPTPRRSTFSVDGPLIEGCASLPRDVSCEPPGLVSATLRWIFMARSAPTRRTLDERAALSQGTWQGSQAPLHGTRPDGEPQRTRCRPRPRALPSGTGRCAWSRRADRARPNTLGADERTTPGTSSMNRARCTRRVSRANANGRSSAIDRRTTWHPGYAIGQPIRKRSRSRLGGTANGSADVGSWKQLGRIGEGDEAILKAKRMTS